MRQAHCTEQAVDEQSKTFLAQYTVALQSYLAHGQPANPGQARELGRKALAEGFSVLDLAGAHLSATARLFSAPPRLTGADASLEAAGRFLFEALTPFAEAQREFEQTNRNLRQLNQTGSQRNLELAGINRDLQSEVLDRKRTERALRESEDHYRVLFDEARRVQENLRNLSKQILHVQDEERKRISRELHDEVGQALTAINVQLTSLRNATDLAHTRSKLADAQRLLQETMETVHRFSRELRPAVLDDLGLVPALRSYVKAFGERTSVQASLRASSRVENLTDEQKVVLYRVAQESLTNVAKHAQATKVVIKLRQLKNAVGMEIKDNGKSFRLDQQARSDGRQRLGLVGIEERVRLVQGRFALDAQPGKGTTVRVEIPLTFARATA